MKIFVSHSNEFDYGNELYKPIRFSQLNKEYEFFLPHEDGTSVNTQEIIKNSDLILAEVSFPSTGQGIELGWANFSKIPVVCFYKENKKISGSLKYLTQDFFTYSDSKDFISKLESVLKSK